MNTNSELIFSKQFDKNMSAECFVSNNSDFYVWEFIIKGKENKTIDKFKISKEKLKVNSPFANRANFYQHLKVLSVFKQDDNLVFLLDKFGQIDVQIYPLSGYNNKTIIPVKKYQLFPMDTELLGEDFQDIKKVNNTIYTLSKNLRGNVGLYYISIINLENKKSQEGSVNTSSEESTIDENKNNMLVQLEDSSYQSTGFGFKFSLLADNYVDIEKNKTKNFLRKINFKTLNDYKNFNINSIIE